MILHLEWAFVAVGLVFGGCVWAIPAGATPEFDVVVNDMAVVNDVEFGAADDLALVVKFRAGEGDVVGLPLTGFAAGIDEWYGTTVEGAALAVGVCLIVVAVEHLDFVLTHEEDTAIASSLTIAFNFFWCGKFDVEFAGSELLFALDVAGTADGFQCAVDEFPLGWTAFFVGPIFVGLLGSVE